MVYHFKFVRQIDYIEFHPTDSKSSLKGVWS